MEDIYSKIVTRVEQGESAVLATIIRQRGSSPRGAGSKCLIMQDGSFLGSVGGGVLEVKTLEKAKEVFDSGHPARLNFTLRGSDVADTEMLCGGDVEVFLELVPYDDTGYLSIFRDAYRVIKGGEKGFMAVVVDPQLWHKGSPPKRILITAEGGKKGALSKEGHLDNAVEEKIKDLPASPKPMLLSLEASDEQTAEVFLEPLFPKVPLYVFGGGHISRQIVPLASNVDFQAVVIDDRAEFAQPEAFPGAFDVRHHPFDKAFSNIRVDESAFIVIVTRGHLHDKLVLSESLKTPASYIGMIGSSRKRNAIYDQLLEEGFTREDLSRVKSPIGIDIHAETPEEIAVSIVSELIKVRAEGKSAMGGSAGSKERHSL